MFDIEDLIPQRTLTVGKVYRGPQKTCGLHLVSQGRCRNKTAYTVSTGKVDVPLCEKHFRSVGPIIAGK
jgi:hypothetical protein